MARLALVTGATGFLAEHLIPALIRDGWQVRATGRRPRPAWLPAEASYQPAELAPAQSYRPAELAPAQSDRPAELAAGPATQDGASEVLTGLVDGVDAVVHLAGATSSLSSQEEMHRSNVVATTNLLAAASTAGVGRFVHMGSTSIYGEEMALPQPLLEGVQPQPSRGYGKEKWLAEQAVWAAAASGLPAVVLRPVSMFGPGAVKLLASAVLDVAIERHSGRATIQVEADPVELRLVHVADVVGATVHLAGADSAIGHAYNVVASWYPSSVEVAGWLAAGVGLPVEVVTAPGAGPPVAERRGAWQAMVDGGMNPSILFTDQRFRFLKKANRNNRLSVDALQATGFAFRYGDATGLAQGVAEAIDWYHARRWII